MIFLRKILHRSRAGRRFPEVRKARTAALWALFLPLAALGADPAAPVRYALDLRSPETHKVKVTMTVPDAAPGTRIQFPVWNALYQIRDFVRNVEDVRAECDGSATDLIREDAETWRLGKEQCSSLVVRYAVYANEEGPFSTALNERHCFINFALVLFYLPQGRDRPARLRFLLPSGWKLATLLEDGETSGEFQAENYDSLADRPAEAGHFSEFSYTQKGATFRVIVDAEGGDYSPAKLLTSLQKITATETDIMRDVPFSRYTFIFHFPRQGGGGGMEHANGTAINVPATALRDDWGRLEATSAHEFFHLWNVKRIRPAGLEPVDYVHGNDTSDLWFSEGVTSTYQELTLLRAGLISRDEFYRRIAFQISTLEDRPARRFQSVEQSGRSAWLEKYLDYFRPDRSISYYNKGELLGFLLDLAIRQGSHNRHSLDDVMRRLNEDFARRGRFFTSADLRAMIAELAPDFAPRDAFFHDYVSGTQELDYNAYLRFAGLRLEMVTGQQATLSFRSARNFDGPIRVQSVDRDGNAAKAGLENGDVLITMNDRPLTDLPELLVTGMKKGDRVSFEVRRGSRLLEIKYRLERTTISSYRVEEIPQATEEQIRLRNGWLEGKTGFEEN